MMKNNKYMIGFFCLMILAFLVSSFYSYIIGTGLQTILVFYELFYIINIYNGKRKKLITIYLLLFIFLMLGYAYLFKDPSTLMNLINIAITPIFISSYYDNNKFSRFKVLEVFKILTIIFSVAYFLTKEYYLIFPIMVLYPFLFSDRDFSVKNEILVYGSTILLLASKSEFFTYPILFSLLVILIYKAFKKDYKNAIAILGLLVISAITVYKLNTYYLFEFNSEVFGDERLIIKLLKVIIPIIPITLYGIVALKDFVKNKFKINDEMLILLVALALFVFASIYVRFDYSFLVIFVASCSLVTFASYNKIMDKKLNDSKVTIMSLHTGFGGIEKYISSLCNMLDNKSIDIISTYKLPKSPAFPFEGASIKYLMDYGPNRDRLKKAYSKFNPIALVKEGIIAINTLINRKAYFIDAVQEDKSRYIITTRDFHNLYAGVYADKHVIKIATEHNYHNDEEGYINKVVNSVRYSNYFVLVSEELKDFYSKRVNKNVRCVYIPNVLDSVSKKKAKFGTHNLITVGRLAEVKGVDDLIDVVKLVSKKISDIHLTIVGDGEEKEELMEQVKDEKLTNNVTFAGFKDSKEIEELLLSSSIYVCGSHSESFGLSIIEAQSYSLPVVAFDSANGVKYLLKNGSGVLVSKRNKQKMAEEIIGLLDDKKAFIEYGKLGNQNARLYLINNVKPQWSKIIK